MALAFEKLSAVRYETFLPLVGDVFLVNGGWQLKLVEVLRYPNASTALGSSKGPLRAPFSLLFEATDAFSLGTGIHCVEHHQLGELPLSINPVQVQTDGLKSTCVPSHYESIFA
ncbi:hypothetical protein CA13_33590 [Planctomycetes bacterium CA13]|uniref:DUF6916 domain-containing protein n=1 Tax=Novipirellula herctigrandis TaxID=2527986 RepID=A0A5C5Z3N0_9BACT|nr:hypothetical protein CA13_33590 [Planctomycetes bacterium CA13]